MELDLHCKAFTGQKATLQRLSVEGNTVRVHDGVAHHFTTCHALSAATIRRAQRIALAAKQAATLLGTPEGAWSETQQAEAQLSDALPKGLTREGALAIARENNAHIHPSRR